MEQTVGYMVIGLLALAFCILPLWNDIWYVLPLKLRFLSSGKKLPPGRMGLPFLGEMLSFLWYFKFLRKPEEYINTKRHKFGDEVGLYRTHLFGKPSVIVCSPQANKLVLQSDEIFLQEWPSAELMGMTSLISVHGEAHDRIRSFLLRGINQPDSLRRIALMIQPRIISALDSWAYKGRIIVYDEVKKVTLENIGKYFVGFEPGPHSLQENKASPTQILLENCW